MDRYQPGRKFRRLVLLCQQFHYDAAIGFYARKAPHFRAESCPTSKRNAAPLQTESVPHLDRNPQTALISNTWR